MEQMIRLVCGMLLCMGANIGLGVANADIKKEFDKTTLANGIKKATAVAISLVMLYCAGVYCLPEIRLIEINGEMLTIVDGLGAIFYAAIGLYGGEALGKVLKVFNLKSKIQEPEVALTIPEETAFDESVG
jgi:hypothetical protein